MLAFSTVGEFIAWEETQERKYEFCDGVVSLRPGGSLGHSEIASNIIVAFRTRGFHAGTVLTSDVKVVTDRASRYPDVTILGDPRDSDMRATAARHPIAIFEVISKSTRATDRGAKVDNYLAIDSLRYYVLIDSTKCWVQTYRRESNGRIVQLPFDKGELTLDAFDVSISLDELYAGTEL